MNQINLSQVKKSVRNKKSNALGHIFSVSWINRRDMKKWYGLLYVTPADVEKWRIKFNGAVMFLDLMHPTKEKVSGYAEN